MCHLGAGSVGQAGLRRVVTKAALLGRWLGQGRAGQVQVAGRLGGPTSAGAEPTSVAGQSCEHRATGPTSRHAPP